MRVQTLSSVPSISKDVLVLVDKKIPCGHALTGQGRNEPIFKIYKRSYQGLSNEGSNIIECSFHF
jgi:hypothetical protein